MRHRDTVVLKKGTWFQMRNGDEALLGEILDFQQDEDNPELYWLKCRMHYDYNTQSEMDFEKLYSSRDFEGFSTLELHTSEVGENLLEDVLESSGDRADTSNNGINLGAPNVSQLLARITSEEAEDHHTLPETRRRPRERAEGQTRPTRPIRENTTQVDPVAEPVYIGRTEFNDNQQLEQDDSKRFQTPLGSGDMKTILSLFSVNPIASWEAINTIIEETGHLILSYTNSSTREKIIQTKLNFLAAHDWVTLEVKSLYELKFKDKITKAIYLGGDHWLMDPNENNEINGLKEQAYIKIDMDQIQSFNVKRLDDSSLVLDIGNKVMSLINPSDLQYLSDKGSQEIFCLADGERNQLVKKDISKSWEKALVYDYYLGGSLDLRLSIKDFNEVNSVKKLATVREDAPVLEALAA